MSKIKRVLIIEDDESIYNLERDYLEIAGYQVQIATTGDEGQEMALNNEIDLVLLDLMLPLRDGFEVCRAIRKEKNIPIIIISAKIEEIDKIRVLGIGADDYVVKPFSPSELVARVGAHLARYDRLVEVAKENSEKGIISSGVLVIDESRHLITINNQAIQFTVKEFELLLFLAKHKNRVFSKSVLFDQVWGQDSMGDTATVTVHINRVREKIEQDTSHPIYIETVWGVGYKFIG